MPPLSAASPAAAAPAETAADLAASAPPVAVILPAFNEEAALGEVLREIPRGLARWVIVADNGSSDRTPEVARAHGARVVFEPVRGYGAACWRGLEALPKDARVVVFLDADHSDYPEDLRELVRPILDGEADLAIGSRTLGRAERGALLPHQRFGNALATTLIRWKTGVRYTDLGPFRAVTREALERIAMQDRGFGWTVEMQLKAARLGLRVREVPVRYRKRIGVSKISGTLSGSLRAGWVILRTIWRSR
ncbi:MAG: glycosyltransferase family 2 protein [Planctomycetota bacterium]|nr:glycosyltransferase family 2 protein [Planctomycetota bacterium]